VGDILTVFVDDYTISTAVKDDLNAQRRSRDLAVRIDQPGSGPGISAGIGSRNNADAQSRGEARRENRFQSELSVRVVRGRPQRHLPGARHPPRGRRQGQAAGHAHPAGCAPRTSRPPTRSRARASRRADRLPVPGPLGKPKQGLVTRVVSLLWP
jgi:flagellar L-ring protein precursor FlgH